MREATTTAEAALAGVWNAYAVTDIRNHTDSDVAYPMTLQLAGDAWAGEFLADVPAKLTWLLRNAGALIGGATDHDQAAAAVQIVVWQTLRNPQGNPPLLPRADLVTPSVDPDVNALAARFTALMEPGVGANDRAGAPPITLTAGPVAACASTIALSGTPGVPVTLSVNNGGVLDTTIVILGDDGTATVTVHGAPGATVAISAAVATGGVLVRADARMIRTFISPRQTNPGPRRNSSSSPGRAWRQQARPSPARPWFPR